MINAAVTGYMVYQHTFYLLSELLDYRPDIVIFFDGANDHFINNPRYDYYQHNRYQFWKERLQHPSAGGMFTYFMHWLSQYSAFARGYMAWKLYRDALENHSRYPTNRMFDNPGQIVQSHKAIAPGQYLRAVETNLTILENHQVKAIVCLQPFLVLRDSAHYSAEEKSFFYDDPCIRILYPAVLDELKAVTSRHRVPMLDINPYFNREEYSRKQLFIDGYHLSPLGSRVSANAIFPVLDSLISTLH